MARRSRPFILLGLAFVTPAAAKDKPPALPAPSHGLSIYGDLKYPPDFTHFEYVNPDAPKGGDVKLSAVGTFAVRNTPPSSSRTASVNVPPTSIPRMATPRL